MSSPFVDAEACERREAPGAGERAKGGGKDSARVGDELSERASATIGGARVPESAWADSSGDRGGNAALKSSNFAVDAGGSG